MCKITHEENNSSLYLHGQILQYNYYHSKQKKKAKNQNNKTHKEKIELGVTTEDEKLLRKETKSKALIITNLCCLCIANGVLQS